MTLPAALRAIREQHGLTQVELASACGHKQSWCSLVERGVKDLTSRDLVLLSHMYGLQLTHGEWSVRAPSRAKTREMAHA